MIISLQGHTAPEVQRIIADHLIRNGIPINRGSWQSTSTDMKVKEESNVVLEFDVSGSQDLWAEDCKPDLPWAEDHFRERVGGEPLNPAPSYLDWPWHSDKYREEFKAKAQRTADGQILRVDPAQRRLQPFDHTYPERFWPKYTGTGHFTTRGIRFPYGDLEDVAELLKREPFTRQAYLPVYFPEDTGSTIGQRVPCTLGYHFIRNRTGLDCNYFLRSCDLTRHFLNDVYMAGRLLQWVTERAQQADGFPHVGQLTLFISNFHLFVNDEWRFQ